MLSVETEMLTWAESGDQNRTLQGHKMAWSAGKGGCRDASRGAAAMPCNSWLGQSCAVPSSGSTLAPLASQLPCHLVARAQRPLT